MEQGVKIDFLEDETYNLLEKKAELEISHDDDVKFSFDTTLPEIELNSLEEEGLKILCQKVVRNMKHVQESLTTELLYPDLKKMYSHFVNSHPKDDLIRGNFILRGIVN